MIRISKIRVKIQFFKKLIRVLNSPSKVTPRNQFSVISAVLYFLTNFLPVYVMKHSTPLSFCKGFTERVNFLCVSYHLLPECLRKFWLKLNNVNVLKFLDFGLICSSQNAIFGFFIWKAITQPILTSLIQKWQK